MPGGWDNYSIVCDTNIGELGSGHCLSIGNTYQCT